MHGAPHDFHHTAAHHLVWQETGFGEARLAVFGSHSRYVAWPYLLRRIELTGPGGEQDLYDITAVDGYSGPVFVGCSPGEPFMACALRSIFETWREARVVSVFARFHPLLMNQLCFQESADSLLPCPSLPGLRHEGHTVSMDLRITDAEARREYRESHLRHIKRAIRHGLTTEIDNSAASLDEFVRLYHQTMRRNNASPHYFFSHQFLERLRQSLALGVSIHLARLEGKAVAAVFITEFSGIVQYLLGGADEAVYHLSPLKLLLDGVRRWARARGNHTFHLGGGRRCQDEDPLFYFKAGFSNRRHCFYTGRWILDQELYDQLSGGRSRQPEADMDYFPAYRTPLNEECRVVQDRSIEVQRVNETKEDPLCANSRSPVQP
jgi:hypothetical protein